MKLGTRIWSESHCFSLVVPAILQYRVPLRPEPRDLFMQQLAHLGGMILHPELFLNHPGDHRRGPDPSV
jgi:hypothetical protein